VASYEVTDVRALDGEDLKAMMHAALLWLRQHQEAINTLNVFPVPDGDTGTNMTLTMDSAWKEIVNEEESHVGRMANKLAHGALMGARGNSGVILSQIWRGFARGLDEKMQMNVDDLSRAMRAAADTAYKGVVKPVEGTILTVVREVAEEVETAAEETEDLLEVFDRMLRRAKAAEARTPALLPVLREAGVVDSGGQGLVVILEGMWRQLNGMPLGESDRLERVVDLETAPAHPHGPGELHFDSNYPYDVQFVIVGQDMDVPEIRANIEAMGDCPLVVGDPQTIKVHVHVPDPGVPISYGAKCGSLRDVVVEDMQAQYQEFISGRDEHPVMGPRAEPQPPMGSQQANVNIGVVVVAAGEGLSDVFRSLGASVIVEGGQTMNPSTAEILEAIDQVAADKVLVLPNNKNILMAAEQAAEVSEERAVAVVPTQSIPQGVSALLALDQQATLDGNVSAMLEMAKQVLTCEVTRATRDVEINNVEVSAGDIIGLMDDELVVGTASLREALLWLLAEADLEMRELVTLYYGEGVNEEEAAEIADELAESYPDLEFEVVPGGQPHYPFIMSIE
jgi:uncharacterized protein